jgi:hypothetical protein
MFTVCGGQVRSATTDGTDLLVGAEHAIVYRFDATNGNYKSTFSVGVNCSAIAMHGGDVLVSDTSGVIKRFDAQTGALKATYDAGFRVNAMIVVTPCLADFNGDGSLNTLDVLLFLNAWSAKDDSADLDGNGTHDTLDVLNFLNLYNAGCN